MSAENLGSLYAFNKLSVSLELKTCPTIPLFLGN